MKNIHRYALGVLSVLVVILGATTISLYCRLLEKRPRTVSVEEQKKAEKAALSDAREA